MIKPAQTTAQQLVKLEPGSQETHELLARICLQVSDYKTAEIHYRAALRESPNDLAILHNLYLALSGQKRYRDGIDILYSALQLDPSESDIQKLLTQAVREWLSHPVFRNRYQQQKQRFPNPFNTSIGTGRDQRNGFWARHGLIINAVIWTLALIAGSLLFGIADQRTQTQHFFVS